MTLSENRIFVADQIKVRSREWAFIPNDWCPLTRGTSEHRDRDTQGEHHVSIKEETKVIHLQAEECQRVPVGCQKPGERHGTHSHKPMKKPC